jgi:ubiquitin-conjugating enzyme E2 H
MQRLKVCGNVFLNEAQPLTVAEYVQKYASKDAADEAGAESEDDDELSSVASFGDDDDEEPAGRLDDV